MFRRMVIAGVGLIGGSLALAARERGLVKEVVGYGRSEKNLRLAKRRGIVDRYFLDERELPADTDMLILATPVQSIASLAAAFLPALESGCLVSDVGSVKERVVREMEKVLPKRIPFVGAHPIAGGEQWGAAPARADLFIGQRCILTPTRHTDKAALKKLKSFWRKVGAKVEIMEPELHDRILGVVSHLPHVLVYALVNLLGRTKVDRVDLKEYCGGGFKDFTRIASSRPELWRDICLLNRKVVSESLAAYIKGLERLNGLIRTGQGALLEKEFASANDTRRQMS